MNRARPVQTVHHTDLHEGFWVQFPEIGGTKEIWIHHKMDAQSFGNRVYNSGFREYGARLRVQGSGLRVQGSGFRIECGQKEKTCFHWRPGRAKAPHTPPPRP